MNKFKKENKLEMFLMDNTLDGGFLQSDLWSVFNEELEKEVLQGGDENNRFLAVLNQLPLVGGYFIIPRGPIINNNFIQKDQKLFLEFLKSLFLRVSWVRIEPQSLSQLDLIKKMIGRDYKIFKAKKDHQPKETLMLDLTFDEKRLLADMKPKTRYNIRLAKKKGVKIVKAGNENMKEFFRLNEKTAKRDGIKVHSRRHYRKIIEINNNQQVQLYLAYYEGRVICAGIFTFYGGVATYLHGASDDKDKSVMAPYALQWKVIQDAKKRGFKKFDFGGIKLSDLEGGSWQGITRFKTGFLKNSKKGEGVVIFPGAYDIVQGQFKYFTYKFLQGVNDLKLKMIKKVKQLRR